MKIRELDRTNAKYSFSSTGGFSAAVGEVEILDDSDPVSIYHYM